MQAQRRSARMSAALQRSPDVLHRYALAMLLSAAVWDGIGSTTSVPQWWPAFSYVALALGTAVGCLAVLLRMLTTAAGARTPLRSAIQLLGLGLTLLAWLLRGHAEIPPELPLVAAAAVGGTLYGAAHRLRRAARVPAHAPGGSAASDSP